MRRTICLVWVFLIVLAFTADLAAQRPPSPKTESSWDVTQARGEKREIDFTTSEGTWMSVDISPDGRWIVFDLLAHIYRVAAEGGPAECLTQESGVALNFHPRFSPDGKEIAFISDRAGQNNLWVMSSDGSNLRPVFSDKDVRAFEPAWTPDGQYILVRRQVTRVAPGPPQTGLWMYHRTGGEGVELVGRDVRAASWSCVSPDGRYVYFHAASGDPAPSGRNDFLSGSFQIKRLELRTGELTDITAGQAQQQYRGSSGGAIAPQVSPDGRWLSFARRIPDGTISYKGKKFGPRTALWLRDLHSGSEHVLMDPIEVDMAEGMKTWRILPGYAWSRDGKSIIIAQGGKLRRLYAQTGKVETIPFTARVRRTISEMAYAPFRISDGSIEVKSTRWPMGSPDGKKLAFHAVGKVWIQELPEGTPRRLTPMDFEPLEYSPAWSPDSRWIAFTSWDDHGRGHLWKAAASGGSPEKLSQEPGEYLHPFWDPDGESILVSRGSGETARGRTWASNSYFDLVRVAVTGGPATHVIKVNPPVPILGSRRQIVQGCFGPEGRIFYPEQKTERREGRDEPVTELASIRADGSDKRIHLKFPFADEVTVSPDSKWVAFGEGDNVYLMPFPWNGTGATPITVEKKRGKLPAKQISLEGGYFPRWRDSTTLEYGSGNQFFAYNVSTEKTEAVRIRLHAPRALPKGKIALEGARIVTLENRKVIERGTVLIEGARIACLGDCSTAGVDRRVDVRGKTIIPGFVDMHAHHYREHAGIIPAHDYENAIYLAYGVTTTLDNSTWSQYVFSAAEMIEAGLVVGPRTFSTGDPLYRGDGARQNEITSYEVAEQNVKRLANWGAVSVKQYLQPRRDQRQWVADVARKSGLMVTAEGDSLEYNLGMIMDGQTGFEHPMSYIPLYSDAARFFGKARAVYSPTFIVGGAGAWNEEYFWQESEVWKDEKQRRFLPWRQLIPHTRRRMIRPVTDYSFPMIAQGLADIAAEGGYGAIGSHGQQHGIGSHWEVWMAASAMGPLGALEVASAHGAHFLGVDRDIGSLESGKLADLIVLNSNPLENIRNTLDIQYVMKAGVLYDGNTLDEIWPKKKPFGEYYWVDRDALKSDDRPVDFWDRKEIGDSHHIPQFPY